MTQRSLIGSSRVTGQRHTTASTARGPKRPYYPPAPQLHQEQDESRTGVDHAAARQPAHVSHDSSSRAEPAGPAACRHTPGTTNGTRRRIRRWSTPAAVRTGATPITPRAHRRGVARRASTHHTHGDERGAALPPHAPPPRECKVIRAQTTQPQHSTTAWDQGTSDGRGTVRLGSAPQSFG